MQHTETIYESIDELVQERRNSVTPVRQQWSYVFLELTHRYVHN